MLAAADVVVLEAALSRALGRRVIVSICVDDCVPALGFSTGDSLETLDASVWPLATLGDDVDTIVRTVAEIVGADKLLPEIKAIELRAETAKSNHLADRAIEWAPSTRPYRVSNHVLDTGGARRDKILIYAASTGTRLPACLDKLEDPAWEVWGMNLIPPTDRRGRVRADIWWDIHQRKAQSADDLRWIAACPRPIFVPDDLVNAGPTCVAFSVDALARALDARCPNFISVDTPFACTFAYQIAYAITIGAKEIALYGVELSIGTRREQTVEWASVNWWLGFATALGVRIEVPPRSRLGQHPYLYGFEYAEEIDDVNDYLLSTADGLRRQLNESTMTKHRLATFVKEEA